MSVVFIRNEIFSVDRREIGEEIIAIRAAARIIVSYLPFKRNKFVGDYAHKCVKYFRLLAGGNREIIIAGKAH